MVDREKVIKGLEHCEKLDWLGCESCPYYEDCESLSSDALALLKAQEQVRPVRIVEHAQGADIVWYECGGCGGLLGAGKEVKNVCPECGKRVKWDA